MAAPAVDQRTAAARRRRRLRSTAQQASREPGLPPATGAGPPPPAHLPGRELDSEHAREYICASMHVDAFQTLADPTRRRIVEALRAGEQAVNDIVDRVDIHQSGVSRHLRILHEAGFVEVRPHGARRLYSLRAGPFRELDAWVARYRALWEARLDRFGAELERRQRAHAGAHKERT
jgi:DNA-binding transcriptional ArsR family regulator